MHLPGSWWGGIGVQNALDDVATEGGGGCGPYGDSHIGGWP